MYFVTSIHRSYHFTLYEFSLVARFRARICL